MSWPRFSRNFGFRTVAVWLLIALVESLHGTLRVLLIAPAIGDLPARRLGFVTACALILAIAWLTARWLDARTPALQWSAGTVWVVLMLAFEIGIGLLQGLGWPRIMQEFDPRQGGLMALGMLILLSAPAFGAWGIARRSTLLNAGKIDTKDAS